MSCKIHWQFAILVFIERFAIQRDSAKLAPRDSRDLRLDQPWAGGELERERERERWRDKEERSKSSQQRREGERREGERKGERESE